MTFGDRLRIVRVTRQFTQKDLARVSAVPQSYISALESGAKTCPSPDIVRKLASALRFSLDGSRDHELPGTPPSEPEDLSKEDLVERVERMEFALQTILGRVSDSTIRDIARRGLG